MSDFEVFEIVNILGLIIGLALGAIAQKNQFCFSGSIKDYILTKSTKRASSVVMAMLTAIIATTIVATIYEIDFRETNYYRENINYFSIILGGVMFGIGMMLADGCSNRQLIKFAQGDKNSLITLVFIAIFAYATVKGLLNGFFGPITNSETLISLSSNIENITMNIYFISALLIVSLYFLVRKIKRVFSILDGVLVGLLVAAAWYVTGVIGADAIERIVDPAGITFVYPTAQTLELFTYYNVTDLSFPISLLIGVLLGAFTMSKFNKRYSFGCTAAKGEDRVKFNMIGGALMGTGGVLSIGCTVGQGLTGLSTLALASALAISSILISGAITAVYLNRKSKLPMCFIFEWEDGELNYQI